MTSRRDNADADDDLTTEGDQPTEIMAATTAPAAAKPAAGSAVKEAPPTAGSAAGDNGTDLPAGPDAEVADPVPAMPADTIGTARDSATFSFSRSKPAPAPAPAVPEADGRTPADHDAPSPEPEPAGSEPAPAATGTGWPSDGSMSGAGPEPAAAAVSAAAFAWDAPEPAPTSPSSAARNFLRSRSAKDSASSQTPAATVVPGPPGQAGLSTGQRPAGVARRSARQAHLTVARVEPWSVMKFSFVVSLVAFVILFVAVSVLYGTLAALGVFTSLQHVVQSVTSSQDSGGVNAARWFTASRVLGYTALLGSLNIVLITAMCTIGAVIYNLTSRLIGGVEVTLRETE
jgi:hypothetical protein